MFNGDLKKEAIARLTQSAESYKYYAKTARVGTISDSVIVHIFNVDIRAITFH